MQLDTAKEIIYEGIKSYGYRVCFERVDGNILASDHFPGRDEPPFKYEDEAWDWAERFAKATFGRNINIYVVNSKTWVPVNNFRSRMIINR